MQTKILTYLAAALLAAGCMNMGEPYAPGELNQLTIQAVYPQGTATRAGASVSIEAVDGSIAYSLKTDASARAETLLPNGIYRVVVRDREGEDVFNGTSDKVLVNREDVQLTMQLKHSKAGALVIKELYTGGCSKAPEEGTWQSDSYVILHNNSVEPIYLDGLCMGTLSPYNATGVNHWKDADGTLPQDFIPITQAVLMIPGDGDDFPLEPGADAVVCLRGAIDHTQQYPLSVNLNQPDYFVCYSPTLFPNPTYHPAPGDRISPERYLEIVIKTGIANAYTISNASPTFVLFRAKETDIHTFVQDPVNIPQEPGSSDKAVAVPLEWVIDAIEVFDGRSSGNAKRLTDILDAGYITLSEPFKGHTVMRKTDTDATLGQGFEVLQDTNNSSEDFYERETQSLHR